MEDSLKRVEKKERDQEEQKRKKRQLKGDRYIEIKSKTYHAILL